MQELLKDLLGELDDRSSKLSGGQSRSRADTVKFTVFQTQLFSGVSIAYSFRVLYFEYCYETNYMLYNPNKVKVGVWLQPEVIANCDIYAEYFSQSRSGFINEALKLYVKHLERHCELLEEREKNGAKIQAQKHEEALVA